MVAVIKSVIIFILFVAISMAETHLHGGIRGGGMSIGIDTTHKMNSGWDYGYGASVTQSSDNPWGLFLSFTKPLGTRSYPSYFNMGPIVYLGTSTAWGGYIHLGWLELLGSPDLRLETGIEVLTSHSEINVEVLYQI
jgi:hypothetical protein